VPLRVAPLGMEEAVLTHQAHFGIGAALRELARGFHGEQHRFILALVWAELFVGELNHPLVIVLDEKVAGWRHGCSSGFAKKLASRMSTQHANEVTSNVPIRAKFGASYGVFACEPMQGAHDAIAVKSWDLPRSQETR
jgi:hypothetical protein